MSINDPYGGDIFAGHARNKTPDYPTVPAEPGLVVEVRATGYVGAVVGFERTYDGDFVRLEDRHGTCSNSAQVPSWSMGRSCRSRAL